MIAAAHVCATPEGQAATKRSAAVARCSCGRTFLKLGEFAYALSGARAWTGAGVDHGAL